MHDDDILDIVEDVQEVNCPEAIERVWRVLIVDDDPDVHSSTVFALSGMPILGRPLEFLHAYSAHEAEQILGREAHIAVILLDVVMESEDAGLALVRIIREELGITESRIILRTGQPGYAPEIDAIRDYDINDYKTKSELSRNGLYTSLTAAIRSYDQIATISASRRGLDMIIRASSQLMARRGSREFAAGIITQISALLGLEPEGIVCVHEIGDDPDQTCVIAAAGAYIDCIDQPLAKLGRPDVAEALKQALKERRSTHTERSTTLIFSSDDGQDMAAYLETGLPLTDNNQRLLEVFCSNIAVNFDNVLLFGRLTDHAYNDQFLRIPNRLSFIQQADLALSGEVGIETMALVDIDHFSHLNDALGHQYGDLLLKAVAARLRDEIAPECIFARVAADTFGIFGSEAHVSPQALCGIFNRPFSVDNADRIISATLGLVRLSEVDGGGADALKAANIALKRAKEHSRGQFCYFTREMAFETRSRVKLLQDLHVAFDSDRLFVVYQPQIDLATGNVIGAEALMRWRNDDGQLIPPDKFIPIAENSGLIIALGAWVLRMACAEQRRLMRIGMAQLRMAVNVSVMQFRHPGFLTMVTDTITETGINPAYLELEITESVAMLDADFMVCMLAKLKKMGITIAIDDFGTGFSSLSYLERLNIDRLKIDRSFVAQMTHAESSRRIVETIVQLARTLSLEAIAEGVETEQEASALRAMGCHEAQGYFYGKPMLSEDFFAFINHSQG